MAQQLTLPIRLDDSASFDNFYVADNAEVVAGLLDALTDVDSLQLVFLHGRSGVGKSHLLQAACHATLCNHRGAAYLPMHETMLKPSMLEAMENMHCVALDDIDAIAGNRSWEQALMGFYERVKQHRCCLVASATAPLSYIDFALPDLKTRLGSQLVYRLAPLDDAQRQQALKQRAMHRGLELNDDVLHYLLNHYSRNVTDVFMLLDRLDTASLRAKRRITVPLVRELLEKDID